MRKLLTQFVICVAILLILATPVFYWLTKSYYAEDMGDLIEAMQAGKSIPKLDLEQDVTKGVMIQFMLIATVLGIAIVLTLRLINKRLWHSFDSTLEAIESFKLEDQELPFPCPTQTSRSSLVSTQLSLASSKKTSRHTDHKRSSPRMPRTSYRHPLPSSKASSTFYSSNRIISQSNKPISSKASLS